MNLKEISQEERDLWSFEASDECGPPSEEDERILRLLSALRAAEAKLVARNKHIHLLLTEKLEQERELDTIKSRLQAAVIENSLMNKKVDLLAGPLDCPPMGFTDCTVACTECRKKYAERAVAAGEG